MLEVVEHLDVDLVVRTVLLEEFSESVCEIVALSQLEDRLLNLFAEPYHSLADEFRSPLARTYKPRGGVSGEKARRVLFQIE